MTENLKHSSMHFSRKHKILLFLALLMWTSVPCFAQFGQKDVFSESSNSPDNTEPKKVDSTYNANKVTFKRYFKALKHQDSVTVGWTFFSSILLPGTGQILNKDEWKLPIFYGGIALTAGAGIYFDWRYKKYGVESYATARNLFFVGTGAFYLASIIDAVACFPTTKRPHQGKAAVFSAIVPGLGQIYMGDWWRVPIYYTGFAISGYCWYYFDKQFKRFRDLYNQAANGEYSGTMSQDNLKYYRNQYRRYRDYAILATVAIYALQIIDANVFSTMSTFDIDEDISMDIEPAIITPIQPKPNYNIASNVGTAYGLSMKFTFGKTK